MVAGHKNTQGENTELPSERFEPTSLAVPATANEGTSCRSVTMEFSIKPQQHSEC